jgi:hypothetical protein
MLWQARNLRVVLRLVFHQPLASQAGFTFQKEQPGKPLAGEKTPERSA